MRQTANNEEIKQTYMTATGELQIVAIQNQEIGMRLTRIGCSFLLPINIGESPAECANDELHELDYDTIRMAVDTYAHKSFLGVIILRSPKTRLTAR